MLRSLIREAPRVAPCRPFRVRIGRRWSVLVPVDRVSGTVLTQKVQTGCEASASNPIHFCLMQALSI
ncbi:hypothetical protein HYPDE_32713 [Hyphomicrobium denitrificans 1NES1]|uniref:Uncharacterized protein n=1 Tax=Hyphomicrobium denitrificans 1NES1 TaxID=670307 RepID=N0BDK2_9HYPH|nr:hypothetical protein HYPDE_32713 [Hyphomicrobium denitrificans 1NES1]